MSCNCHIVPCNCAESIFLGSSWRCNDNTTTSTTSTSTTSTTTSSTTSTTTTLAPQIFTINNDSQYEDLEYFVFGVGNGTQLLTNGFVQPTQSFSQTLSIISGTTSLTIWVKQLSGNIIYVTATLEVTGEPTDIDSYSNGVTEFQFNDLITNALLYELTITDETPITTTTTTSTTSTTTSSSTTTTTTSIAPDPLIIRVLNNRTSAIGFNTMAWYGTTPFTPYYPLLGGLLLGSQTQTAYNSIFGSSNQTTLRYENTGSAGVLVSMYFSDDNGSSYSLLGTANLVGHTGGAYPATQQTFTTNPNNTGVTNIIEFRVTNGEYSTSNYIIRVVNNTGFNVNLNQLIGRTSPSNVSYFTANNPTINSGVTQQFYSGALLEPSTRITINNSPTNEQFNVSFYYSDNNGASYSLVGSGFVTIGGTLDNSYSTPSPGTGIQCILEIRLS